MSIKKIDRGDHGDQRASRAKEVREYILEWREAYGMLLQIFDAPPPDPDLDQAAVDLILRNSKK